MPHQIDQNTCVSCKKCISACPVEAIVALEESKVQINANDCVDCQTCWRICPEKAVDGGSTKYLELRAK